MRREKKSMIRGKYWRMRVHKGVIYLRRMNKYGDEVELVFYDCKSFDDFVRNK